MAFPTVPTVASGDLLSTTTTPASTTHTFPNLSSLRGGAGPQAGDLLLAICVQYQGGTLNAEFGTWGASFTETLDDALASGTGNGAIGVARKIAAGTESGTFTVTSAHSFKSVQFLMRIPAGTWHGTTIPEVQAATRAAGAVADPGSFDPTNWAAEDTLWIAVAGQTETSTTSNPPTIDAPPANYTGELIVPRAADAVGDITAAVAFRQLNATSDDVGTWTASNALRGNGIATVIAVRPGVTTWAGAATTDYTLNTVTQGAPTRFGASVMGPTFGAVTAAYVPSRLEVSWAALETPAAVPTETGAVVFDLTYGSTTQGTVTRNGAVVTALTIGEVTQGISSHTGAAATTNYTLDRVTQGAATHFAATASSYTFGSTTQGAKSAFGAVVTALTYGSTTQALVDAKGATATGLTYGSTTVALVTAKGAVTTALTIAETTQAWVQMFSSVVDALTLGIVTQGTVAGTQTGQVVDALTFASTTQGSATHFGATVSAFTLDRVTQGFATIKGATAGAYTITIVTDGSISGQVFGQVATALTLDRTTVGTLTARGATVLPLTFTSTTVGVRERLGATAGPYTITLVTQGTAAKTGATVLSLADGLVTVGHIGAFGSVSLPLTWLSVASGVPTLMGTAAGIPVLVEIFTDGVANFVMLLDPIHSGRLGTTLAGGLGGAEQGVIGDTVAGTITEDLEEVPA